MKISKWEKWALIVCLVSFCAISFVQFEIEGYKDAISVVSDWIYKQMVITIAPVTPNLGIRERKVQVSDIVATIYKLESSEGKNDSCKAKDAVNGYGFRPGTCYDTHERVKSYVTDWVSSMLDQGYSKSELMCYYNLGKVKGKIINNCEYYQNSLKLN